MKEDSLRTGWEGKDSSILHCDGDDKSVPTFCPAGVGMRAVLAKTVQPYS